jgi:endonuclease YncB( thermonuclease family)
VKDRILNKIVMIKCYGDDKYGRLLADIYLCENKKRCEQSISKEIIDKKFGVFYDGKKKN